MIEGNIRINQNLIIGIKRGFFRKDDKNSHIADAEFSKVKETVRRVTHNICYHCGYKDDKYQDIHHINDDHSNNRIENLTVLCKLCHSCYHIGYASMNEGGYLVLLPEISQATLNHFIRIIGVVNILAEPNSKIYNFSNEFNSFLINRRKMLANSSFGTSDPILLANILSELSDEDYRNRDSVLRDIKFVPNSSSPMMAVMNSTIFDYWANNSFSSVPPKIWEQLYKHIKKTMQEKIDLETESGKIAAPSIETLDGNDNEDENEIEDETEDEPEDEPEDQDDGSDGNH